MPHTLKCCAMTGTETKVACVKQASFFNVPLDYFQNDFLEQFACCEQDPNRKQTYRHWVLGVFRVKL
jgi:hypothetical protein